MSFSLAVAVRGNSSTDTTLPSRSRSPCMDVRGLSGGMDTLLRSSFMLERRCKVAAAASMELRRTCSTRSISSPLSIGFLPSRVSHFGPRVEIIIIPSGAVKMIENTAVVKMSLPHLTYSSLLPCSRMESSGSDANAACTVALGTHARAINKRSMNVSFLLPFPPPTAKKAMGNRTLNPMSNKPMDLGIVDGVMSSNFTAEPITPKSRG
mmetsp:Transcript_8720/g.32464  ORF Transcript_8720/g.32464 Transcript_8720/m.32464 type:complete len:209 (-) Transcript_8720:1296-1922(-)